MKNSITKEWLAHFHTLNESERRKYAGKKAKELGFGGINQVQKATGLSRPTIRKGMRELEMPDQQNKTGRIRRKGGGRKKTEKADVLKKMANVLKGHGKYQEVAEELSALEKKIRKLDKISEQEGGTKYESLEEAEKFFTKKVKNPK